MAEQSERTQSKEKRSSKSIFKMILGVALFLAVCFLYGWISGVYAWGENSLFDSIFDIPFLLMMAIYVLPLIAVSQNLGTLFEGIKTVFSEKKITISQKNLFLNAVKTTMSLNWYAAFSGAICGWIAILCYLENRSSLPANLAVTIIPFFYATCLNLFLLLVEIRITKAAE